MWPSQISIFFITVLCTDILRKKDTKRALKIIPFYTEEMAVEMFLKF